MQEIEIERTAENFAALGAGAFEMCRATIGNPPALGPNEPSFGDERELGAWNFGAVERGGEQSFVVVELAIVVRVTIGGIEEAHAGVERSGESMERAGFVAVGRGGEAHTAEAGDPRESHDLR